MSEHDEEEPSPGPRHPGPPRRTGGDYTVPGNPWSPPSYEPAAYEPPVYEAPAYEPPTYQTPTWPSPGWGRPYPGEAGATEPTPTRTPNTPPSGAPPTPPGDNSPPFAYPYRPYPSAAPGARPNYGESPTYGGPPVYGDPQSYPYGDPQSYPPYGDPQSYPYGDPQSYPPYGDPQSYPYGDPPAYPYGDAPRYGTPPGYGPPTYPGAGGGQGGWRPPPGGYGPWGAAPTGGWAPPPVPPPKRSNPLAIIGIAILVAALIGLAIGGQLVRRSSSTTGHLPTLFPFTTPPPQTVPPAGNSVPTAQAQAIAAAVDPSIVDINTKLGYQRAAAAGTGMIISTDGEILTNNHVIAGSTSITATVIGGKTYTAKVVGTDPAEDVAVIRLDNASGLPPIKSGDPSKLAPGDPVVAVGNAGGVGGTPSVVTGTVVALDQSVTASDMGGGNAEQLNGMIEINAPLQPGDSGGPLINTSKLVVGMDTAASASNQVESQSSVGFAIPITKALSIAQQIMAGHAGGNIQIGLPGFLGVSVTASSTGGAALQSVLPGGPAEKAGLTAGDVITAVNGQAVDSAKALTTVLQQKHPGDKVTITWTDTNGKSHTATITLTTGPAA